MALPVTDTFTTGSDQALTSYSAAWTVLEGSPNVAAPAGLDAGGGGYSTARRNDETFNADQYAQLVLVPSGGTYPGPAVRCQSGANTSYHCETDGSGTVYLSKCVAGSQSTLTSFSQSASTGDVLRLEVTGVGATVTLEVLFAVAASPTSFSTVGTYNDTAGDRITTAGQAGVFVYGSQTFNPQSGAWTAGNLGGGSTPITGSGSAAFGGSGVLTGKGVLVATAALVFASTAVLTGRGAITGTGSTAFGGSGVLTGRGVLASSASAAFGGSGVLTGKGVLVGAGSAAFDGSGTLADAAGPLTGTGSAVFGGSGVLTGKGVLVGAANAALGSTAALTGKGTLVGAGAAAFGSTAALTGKGVLVGAASATFDSAAALTGKGLLVGTGSFAFDGSGALFSVGALTGSGSFTFDGSGVLTGKGILIGSGSFAFDGSGVFSGGDTDITPDVSTTYTYSADPGVYAGGATAQPDASSCSMSSGDPTISTTADQYPAIGDRKHVFPGNGSRVLFPITFSFASSSHLRVWLENSVTGEVMNLLRDQDYEIRGAQVRMVVAPAVGEDLVVLRYSPAMQQAKQLSPAAFSQQLDNGWRLVQEIRERMSRTLHVGNFEGAGEVKVRRSLQTRITSGGIPTVAETVRHVELLMLAHNQGVYVSTNGGVSFSTTPRGYVGMSASAGQCAMAYSPELDTIVASNDVSPPRYSLDRGATWANCVHSTAWSTTPYLPGNKIAWHATLQKFVLFYNRGPHTGGAPYPNSPVTAVSDDGINWTDSGSYPYDGGSPDYNMHGEPYICWLRPDTETAHAVYAGGLYIGTPGSLTTFTRVAQASPSPPFTSRNMQVAHPTSGLVIACENNYKARSINSNTTPFTYTDLGANTNGGNRAVWCDSLGLWVMGGSFDYPRWSTDGSAGSWVTGSGVASGAGGAGTYNTEWCPEAAAAFVCGQSGSTFYAKRSVDGKTWVNCNPFNASSGARPQQIIETVYYD